MWRELESVNFRSLTRRDVLINVICVLLTLVYAAIIFGGGQAPTRQAVRVQASPMPVVSMPGMSTIIVESSPADQLVGQVLAAVSEVKPRPKPETYAPLEFVVVMPGMAYDQGCGAEQALLSKGYYYCREGTTTSFVLHYRPDLDPTKAQIAGYAIRVYLESIVDEVGSGSYQEVLVLLLAGDRLSNEFYQQLKNAG